MNQELERRAQDLVEACLPLGAGERATLLDAECGRAGPLRDRVESLLRAAARAGAFLETPVLGAPRQPAQRLIGRQVGLYRIDSILGSGGMATVFLATQQHPHRQVALKLMSAGIMSRTAWRRFEYESQILGRLGHPNIAKVYEAGTHDDGSGGVPYFAMEYIANARTLTEYARHHRIELQARLRLFAKICDAVHHGHQKGIIHRDLKPANILVDAAGAPHVIDFGVARVTDADLAVTTAHTAAGQLVGTLQYMSPEQCEGDPERIDVRSDVYALGVVLYELLCGRPPYQVDDRSIFDAAQVIRDQRPTRLGSVHRTLRGDLDTIVLKAMEKDPEMRYQSAAELADDLRRFLDRDPIRARPPTFTYRARMFARRNKALVGAVVTVMLVLVAAGAVSIAFAVAARAQRDAAVWKTYTASIAGAESAHQAGEFRRMRTILAAAPPRHRDWEWRFLDRRADPSLHTFRSGAPLAAIAVSPSDSRLAAAAGKVIELWDAATGEAVKSFGGHDGAVTCAAFDPEGARLATGSTDGTVRIRDAATGGELVALRGHEDRVTAVLFTPDGSRVASGSADRTIRLWDDVSGEELNRVRDDLYVWSLAISPDGSLLAAGLQNDIRIRDTATGAAVRTLRGHAHLVASVAFSPDGAHVASGSWDDTIRVWDVVRGETRVTIDGHADRVGAVAFSPDGARVASASRDKTVRLWDARTGEELARLRGHGDEVVALAFMAEGTRLVSGSTDRSIRVWETSSPEDGDILRGHENKVGSIAYSPDGTLLASSSTDRTIKLWDVVSGTSLATLRGHAKEVSSVSFSPDGTRLATGSHDRTVMIWSADTGRPLRSIPAHDDIVTSVAFSPTGDLIASASWDRTIGLWGPDTGAEVARLHGHEDRVISLAFSPDGRRLASGSEDGAVRIWDPDDGTAVQVLEGHGGRVDDVAFSPDGRTLASASWDYTIGLWDPATGDRIDTLRGHENNVASLSFSPDGRRLASGSKDNTVKIWDPATGSELLTLRGHTRLVDAVAFSPDGTRLVSAGGWGDPTIRLWDTLPRHRRLREQLAAAALRAEVKALVGRLLGELGEPALVAGALRSDPALDASRRGSALQVLLRSAGTN